MEHKPYAFTTLAIGVEYREKVKTLIDCVNTLTFADLIIITDDVDHIFNYVSNNSSYLDHRRIKIISLRDVTDKSEWYNGKKNLFNYNLKYYAVYYPYSLDKYDTIIYADADGFIINWDEVGFNAFMEQMESGMIARFRGRPEDETGIAFLLEPKARELSINLQDIGAELPLEVFMVFNPKHENFSTFIDEWEMIINRAYGRGVNPFLEALEISYALSESKLPCESIYNFFSEFPVLHSFRYVHQNKIMRIG